MLYRLLANQFLGVADVHSKRYVSMEWREGERGFGVDDY
jgi:hypothetical protein